MSEQESAATRVGVAEVNESAITKDQLIERLNNSQKTIEPETQDDVVTPKNQKAEKIKPDETKDTNRPPKAKEESEDEPDEEGEELPEGDDESDDELDAEEEINPDDEEEEPESEEDEEIYELKINGKLETFTLDELKQAASKAKGAEAKFEEAATLKSSLEQEKLGFEKHAKEASEHLIDLGRKLIEQLEVDTRYSKEEMEDLRYTNPTEWSARKLEIQEQQQLINRTRAIAQQQKEAESQQRKAEYERFAKEQAEELRARHSEFKDAEVFEKTLRRGSEYLIKKGFTSEEVNGLVNADMWDIVLNSMRYEQAKAKVKGVTDKVKNAPKMMKPGVKQPPISSTGKLERQLAKLQSQLQATGSPKVATQIMALKQEIAASRKG